MIEFTNEPEFDFGSGEYREFFSRFGLTPFQHPDWLQPFYRRLPAATGQTPLILVGRQNRTRQLRSVVPLLRHDNGKTHHITSAFLEVSDYACPVIDPAVLGHISLQREIGRLLGDHELEIAPIHSDHRGIWSALMGCPPVPLGFGSHAVDFGSTMDAVHGKGTTRTISGLRRKERRLAELGDLWIEPVKGHEAGVTIRMARQFRAGRFHNDPLQVDPSADFYADVASGAGGLSRTFRMVCGGRIVAVMFGLVHRRRFHYILLACDYTRYAKYSPGLLIMDRAIQAWADAGGEVFDFTIGDEPFKARFGCSRSPMYSIASSYDKSSEPDLAASACSGQVGSPDR